MTVQTEQQRLAQFEHFRLQEEQGSRSHCEQDVLHGALFWHTQQPDGGSPGNKNGLFFFFKHTTVKSQFIQLLHCLSSLGSQVSSNQIRTFVPQMFLVFNYKLQNLTFIFYLTCGHLGHGLTQDDPRWLSKRWSPPWIGRQSNTLKIYSRHDKHSANGQFRASDCTISH